MKKGAIAGLVFIIVAFSLSSILFSCRSRSHSSAPYAVYVTNNTNTTSSGPTGDDNGGGAGGGGTGGDTGGGGGTGVIVDLSLFSQVTATITNIQLVNTETGATCQLLIDTTALDITGVQDIMQFVSAGECDRASFNRLQIQFIKNAQILSGPTGTPSSCSFVSYKDTGSSKQPNILLCDENICTLNINGAVHLLWGQQNKLGLDFHLKDFEIADVGTPECSITMKVSPLNHSQIRNLGHPEAITGLISNLNTANATFDLTRGNRTFTVLYSGITATDQPGLDILLQRAQSDRLRAWVTCPDIDFDNNSIVASKIRVKVEGLVSSLVTNETFSVAYGEAGSLNIDVDYSNATVEGTLTDGSWVDVKLYGYAAADNDFLANKVEVESQGLMIED